MLNGSQGHSRFFTDDLRIFDEFADLNMSNSVFLFQFLYIIHHLFEGFIVGCHIMTTPMQYI